MILETDRLMLRPWRESDAGSLYEYAKDPAVGPAAGWPPHKNVGESLAVIKNVLNGAQCYAICLKPEGKAIGSIELMLNGHTKMTKKDDECELGYWLGTPFWGNGYMPEAARELIRYGFTELHMRKIWCGYYEGNEKSKRVQDKCGFTYHHTVAAVEVPLLNEVRTEHTSLLTREQWMAAQGAEKALRETPDQSETKRGKAAVLYVHGKGGSAAEAEYYKKFFPAQDVFGVDYTEYLPWVASELIARTYDGLPGSYDAVFLIANSIGAYFSMLALQSRRIKKAFLISPILNMERLITDMMSLAGVSEAALEEKGEIPTDFGETLSWEYLCYVRNNPIAWDVPTAVLYAGKDELTARQTVDEFVRSHGAALTVMENGEHWFHTAEQLAFLDKWMAREAAGLPSLAERI